MEYSWLPASTEQLEKAVFRHVDVLAGLIGQRDVTRPGALLAAGDYCRRELAAIGPGMSDVSYQTSGITLSNVVLECPGNKKPGEVLIIGAHYDSDARTPGADDNASAVAMLIEAARLISRVPLSRTVRFVAFPCEEMPHFATNSMGSQVYARHCKAKNEQVVGMICLEMVGYFRDEPGSQQYPPAIPSWLTRVLPKRGNFLAAVANLRSNWLLYHFARGFKRASKLPLLPVPLPEAIPEIHLSDHRSFWELGYPALMLTDTSFLRNPHYHLRSDLPKTLDYPRLCLGTLGLAGAITRLAG